jgi:S1-C subfamily serine protease
MMPIRRLLLVPLAALALLLAHAGVGAAAPSSGSPPAAPSASEAERRAAQTMIAALDNVVKLKVTALANARSGRSLGREREGSGVLLADSGLVLTIGYLILEADSIELTDHTGRIISGSVAAYDHASGFGLIKPAAALGAKGIPIGSSGDVNEYDKLIFATHGGKEGASLATVASKRRFAGYWEYLIDDAIFTVPPRGDHSGAALITLDGQLVGIGSLIVADAATPNRRFPGNMFVPVDLLKPILSELTRTGRSKESTRPWIGMSTQEVDGRLHVIRVQEDTPAARAGLKPGDIVLSIKGEPVKTLEEFYRKLWGSGSAGSSIPLKVLQGSDVRDIDVRSIDRMDYVRTKEAL